MRIRMWLFAIPLSLTLSSLLSAQDPEKYDLRWKFKKGNTMRYEMNMLNTIDVAGMEIEQQFLFDMTQKVRSVNKKGVATLRVTYNRIKFRLSGMMETDYDSDRDKEPPEDVMGKLMSAFLGKTFTMKMGPKGEVLEVKGIAKIMEEAIEEMEDDEQGAMMAEMIKGAYDDERAKQMMTMSYAALPKKPVGEGDTWESDGSWSMPMMAEFSMKNESRLKNVSSNGKKAHIETKTTIEISESDEEENPLGGMMDLSEAEMKTSIVWRIDRGMLETSKSTMTVTMDMGGQEIELGVEVTMKRMPAKGDKSRKAVPSEGKRKRKDY